MQMPNHREVVIIQLSKWIYELNLSRKSFHIEIQSSMPEQQSDKDVPRPDAWKKVRALGLYS